MKTVKITDDGQWKEQIRDFRRKYGKVETNCFLLPGDYRELVRTKEVVSWENENCLLFLVQEKGFGQVYYFMAGAPKISLPPEPGILLMDLVSRSAGGEDLPALARPWMEAGFGLYKSYMRMELPLTEKTEEIEADPQLHFGCGICSLDEVEDLWQNALDPFDSPLPQIEEIRAQAEADNLFWVSGQGRILAALLMKPQNAGCLLQHIAVRQECRGQGIAGKLMNYALGKMKERDIRICRLWVAEQNTSAVRAYEKMRFKKDGMYSVKYIFRRKGSFLYGSRA